MDGEPLCRVSYRSIPLAYEGEASKVATSVETTSRKRTRFRCALVGRFGVAALVEPLGC